MEDKIFIDGMIFKAPHEKAPEFIKGTLSVKCEDFLAFMKVHSNKGWLNIDLKESKNGKYYAELNTWNPDQKQGAQFDSQGNRTNARGEDDFIF